MCPFSLVELFATILIIGIASCGYSYYTMAAFFLALGIAMYYVFIPTFFIFLELVLAPLYLDNPDIYIH
jgi:hypothetical protein